MINDSVESAEDEEEDEEEEPWSKRYPPYNTQMEIEQLDEFYMLHLQIVPSRVVPCCVDCAEITAISLIAVEKLNSDRANDGMPLLCLVKIIYATKQSVQGTNFHVQMLFKLAKRNKEEQNDSLSPIYLFKIYRDFNNIVEIGYEEITTFANVSGGRWRLSTGNFMPKIGLQCSPIWSELEAEQFVVVALEAGFRMFDTSFFSHNRGQISKAIKKYLPLFGLRRTDVFISAKINIVRPDNAENLVKRTDEINKDQFHSVSDYAHFCVKQCIEQFEGYIDLCMVHYPKDVSKNVSNTCTNNKSDREEVYGVLNHYMDIGTVRSIGVANFDSDHIERLLKDGKYCVPAVVQCEMHPFLQRDDLIDYCNSKGIFLQAHSLFAYKQQKHSYNKRHQRYSMLKRVSSFYKIGTSQLSLSYIMQRAPHVGAVILEQPRGVLSCQQIRRLLTGLMFSVCNNDDTDDNNPPQQQQFRLSDDHMRVMQRMDMGKLGGGRCTDCEQWKVM